MAVPSRQISAPLSRLRVLARNALGGAAGPLGLVGVAFVSFVGEICGVLSKGSKIED